MLRIGDIAIYLVPWALVLLTVLTALAAWRLLCIKRWWAGMPGVLLAALALLFLGATTTGVPIVYSNAQLMLLPSWQYWAVLRLGVNQLGDAPPLWFSATASPCTIAGGDVGTQNPTVDGGCFNALPVSGPSDVREWGIGTTGANDVTPQLTAAAATGRSLFFPPGAYQFAALTLSGSSQTITCSGQGWDGAGQTTWLAQNATGGDFITLAGKRNAISGCLFEPTVRVTGYQVVFAYSCYQCLIDRFHMSYVYNGINDIANGATIGSAQISLMGPISGPIGIRFAGAGTPPTSPQTNIIAINNVLINNAYYAVASGNQVKTWAPNMAMPANSIVDTNNAIYETTAACTTAASGGGPAGWPAGTSAASIYTGSVPDGSCNWRFISNNLIGFLNDSWGMSATINNFTVLNNYQCIVVRDSNPSQNSEPSFLFFVRPSCDHNFANAVEIDGGVGVEIDNIYVGSDFVGSGIVFGSGFTGDGKVIGGLANVNAQNGIQLNSGKVTINAVNAAGNSIAGAGTYANIEVAAGVSNFIVTSNRVNGANIVEGSPAVWAQAGVKIESGASNNYVVTGNICGGAAQVTGGVCVVDGGSGASKTVSGNW